MSKALACDNCGETLTLDRRGESSDGEDAAWIGLELANEHYDLCTRSCVIAFLEREDVIAIHDGWSETITGIARSISEAREQESDDDD